ncbi:MAG: hypothetical protein ACI8ZM_001643 [Crocinitomix sp.]|jgi:hypothetical protein
MARTNQKIWWTQLVTLYLELSIKTLLTIISVSHWLSSVSLNSDCTNIRPNNKQEL